MTPWRRRHLYEQFAADAAALLAPWMLSVNRVASMSATFRKDGWNAAVPAAIGGLTADAFKMRARPWR